MYCTNMALSYPADKPSLMSIQPYTEDQSDALQEVVNIAMGQAGDSLARILGNFVALSVPRIRLATGKDVIKTATGMVDNNTEVDQSLFKDFPSLPGNSVPIYLRFSSFSQQPRFRHQPIDRIKHFTHQKIII